MKNNLGKVYLASTSQNDLARRLGCHYSKAVRIFTEAGFEIPAAHWEKKLKLDVHEAVKQDLAEQRLKNELSELKTKNRILKQRTNIHEDVLDAFRDVYMPFEAVAPVPPHVGTGDTEEDAILGQADWHTGEVIDLEVMQGLNSYDPTIMQRRACTVTDTTLSLLFHNHSGTTFKRLFVFNLGDNVSGDLLDDNKITNAIPVFEAMRLVARTQALVLCELAAHLSEVVAIYVPGNHGRRFAKMAWKLPTETADWLVGEMVKDLCSQNKRITVLVPKAWSAKVEVRGHTHSLNHGYSAAKGGYGGIPFYSFQRSDGKKTAIDQRVGELTDYRWYGHIHTGAELPRMGGVGKQFIVPSLMGGNEYALEALDSYDDPGQLLVGAHEEFGATWRYPLVINRHDDVPCRYEAILS